MKKLSDKTEIRTSAALRKLLAERKMPLSESRQDTVLKELGKQTARSEFLLYCRVSAENGSDPEVPAGQIQETAFLLADGARLLPVFSNADLLYPGLEDRKGLSPYAADFLDLITFLDCNPETEAAVLNPGEDDLILTKDLMVRLLQAYGTEKEQETMNT